jgi:hypothetical protein
VHFTSRGSVYLRPSELVQSAAFWREIVRVRVALEAGRNGLGDPGHEGKGLETVASLPPVQP